MPHVRHQPSLAEDAMRLWLLPWEIGAECALAAYGLAAQGMEKKHPESQLPLPHTIEEHGEHCLFA